MTKFIFKKDELNITENNIDNFIINDDDKLTNIIKNYLNFIYKKSTIPKLPSNINVVYVDIRYH